MLYGGNTLRVRLWMWGYMGGSVSTTLPTHTKHPGKAAAPLTHGTRQWQEEEQEEQEEQEEETPKAAPKAETPKGRGKRKPARAAPGSGKKETATKRTRAR
jgi:hypothetical protein